MTNRSTYNRRKWLRISSFSTFGTVFVAAFLISTLCIFQLLTHNASVPSARRFLERKPENPELGRYGELMISFLREDLPFTIFVPSASSFESMFEVINRRSNVSDKALQISSNDSQVGLLREGTFAVISRIFGFSAVPRRIFSGMVPVYGELDFESVSGYKLYLARQPGGALLVNNLVCNRLDMTRGLIVIHVVDGIIMDSDFEQSFMPYPDEF